MDARISPTRSIRGTVSLPADKAICHRAALLAALATDATEISPWASGDDCQRTLSVLQGLGVPVSRTDGGVRIDGVGLAGLRVPAGPLHCGDSGTTIRLACGILAGQLFTSRLTADRSLSQRPMRRIVEPLARMGVRFERGGGSGEIYPPLILTGRRPLAGIEYQMPVASAQVKSAILLAGLYADRATSVIESTPTRDHTERLLSRFGVPVRREGQRIVIEPPQGDLRSGGQVQVPGDPSSAAFFLVAAAVVPDSELTIRDMSLNPTRVRFLEVLTRMGASIRCDAQPDPWEPRGTVTVRSSALRGVTVAPEEVPQLIDELPVLMVAACAAEGETRFEGIGELRVKETDRLRSMTAGLAAMGAQVQSGSSRVVVRRSRLRGADVDSFGDHRTAMSLAVAGLFAAGDTRIRGAECVSKSLHNFFDLLASIRRG